MDPRQFGPQQRKARLSKLAAAQKRARASNQVVNVCPFGCTDNNLDGNGYCYHLVGTSNDKMSMEPMFLDPQRHIRRTDGKKRQKLKDGDKLVRCSNNFRVYRDVKPTADDLRYIEVHGQQSEENYEGIQDEVTFRDKPKPEEEEIEITTEESDAPEETEGEANPLTYKGARIT